jgi:hypothetical protein
MRLSLRPSGFDAENPAKSRKSTNEGKSLLDAVLDNERKYPISFQDFMQFLESEKAEELVLFYQDAKKHHALALLPSDKSLAVTMAHTMASQYIEDGAEQQINIGDADKTKILRNVAVEETAADPALFTPAVRQVKDMLNHGSFQRFISRTMNQNITGDEAWIRYRKAFACASVAAVLFAAAILLQVLLPPGGTTVFANRWWRLLCCPFIVLAFLYSTSAYCRVCTDLAYRGIRMKEQDKYAEMQAGSGLADARRIADELVGTAMEKLGTKVFWKGIGYGLLGTAVCLALPPGY